MSEPTNSYVQVAPDSTGKKIRNLEAIQIQGDGSSATVETQVVSLQDSDGEIVNSRKLLEAIEYLTLAIEELPMKFREALDS